MTSTRTLRLLIAVLLISGCAGNPFQADIHTVQRGDLDVVTHNPELDVVVFKGQTDTDRYCMSPETDAVPTDAAGFAVTYSGNSASESGDAGAAVLGGRSPAVLITREILYRACELSLNFNLEKAEAIDLFQQSLSQVTAIAEADNQPGTGDLGVAATPVSN